MKQVEDFIVNTSTLAGVRNFEAFYCCFQQYCVPDSIIDLTRPNSNYVLHCSSSNFFRFSAENSTSGLSWAAEVFFVLYILFLHSSVNDLHTST
jgi:hypothetical protein